jgi:ABC-2 type transport system permease protein
MPPLLKLTWLEIKIFAREPLGLFGTIAIPVLSFVVIGRLLGRGFALSSARAGRFVAVDLPVFAAFLIAIGAILSLITIVSIYREAGILKRLRATPLGAHTILTAHVLVKLTMTAVTTVILVAAGKRYYPVQIDVPVLKFGAALLFTTISIISLGFLIASVVPTARFAQPLATMLLYPLVGISGLFVPVAALPPALQIVARLSPFTYAASLLRGMWVGDAWSAHVGDVAALLLFFAVCSALSVRVFRWE